MRTLILALSLACAHRASSEGGPRSAEKSTPDITDEVRLVPQVVPRSGATRLMVSPGGGRAMTYGDDGHVTVWQVRSGAVLGQAPLSLSGVQDALWVENEVLLVLDDTGELYRESLSGEEARLLERRACRLALSPLGRELLVSRDDGRVILLAPTSEETETQALGRWEGCPRVGWLDANTVLVGGDGEPLQRINLQGAPEDREIAAETSLDEITEVTAIASGQGYALVASAAQVWEVGPEGARALHPLLPEGATVTGLVARPRGAYALELEREDGPTVLYVPSEGAAPTPLRPGATTVAALPGEGLLVGLAEGGAVVLNPSELPVTLDAPEAPAASIAAGGHRLLQPGADGALLLWDLLGGRLERSWTLPGLAAVALSPDGRFAAAATDQGELYRWHLDRQARPQQVPGVARARSLALALDSTLAVGTTGGQAVIVQPDGVIKRTVPVAADGDVLVAITPEGTLGLAAATDGEVVLFDPGSDLELDSRRRVSMRPRAVALTERGEAAYIVGDRGRRKGGVWALRDGRLREIGPWGLRVPVLALALPPGGSDQDQRPDLKIALSDGRVCTLSQNTGINKLSCIAASSDLFVGLAYVKGLRPLLVRGASSGAVSLWSAQTDAWMGTLAGASMRGEEQWAVAGPGGRYDSAWNGDVDFAHLVQTPEAGLPESSAALWQVKADLYARDLLARILRGRPPAPPSFVAVASLPDVYPIGSVLASDPVVRVCVVKRDASKVSLRVALNDWEVPNARSTAVACPGPDGSAGDIWEAHLDPTELRDPLASNQISVTAMDDRAPPRAGRPLLLPVLREAPEAGSLLVIQDAQDETIGAPVGVRALVVGVSTYAEPSLNLAWPAQDARGVATALRVGARQEGMRAAVALLTSEQGSTATGATLLSALRAVAAEAEASEVLVVFLAGHGAMVGGSWRFFASDATTTAPQTADEARGVSLSTEEIADALRGSRASRVVLVLDTCASGAVAQDLAALTERSGLYVLAASRGPAHESDLVQHGLLTWSLLNVLTSPDLLPGGLWELDRVLPLASEGVAQVARDQGLTVTQQPVVARPRLQERVTIGAVDPALRETLKLQDPAPRLSVALLERSTLVDQGDWMAQVRGALEKKSPRLALVNTGGAWKLGGIYAGSPEERCATVSLYRGSSAYGMASFRGADEALVQEIADWAYGCVFDEECASPAAEAPCR